MKQRLVLETDFRIKRNEKSTTFAQCEHFNRFHWHCSSSQQLEHAGISRNYSTRSLLFLDFIRKCLSWVFIVDHNSISHVCQSAEIVAIIFNANKCLLLVRDVWSLIFRRVGQWLNLSLSTHRDSCNTFRFDHDSIHTVHFAWNKISKIQVLFKRRRWWQAKKKKLTWQEMKLLWEMLKPAAIKKIVLAYVVSFLLRNRRRN